MVLWHFSVLSKSGIQQVTDLLGGASSKSQQKLFLSVSVDRLSSLSFLVSRLSFSKKTTHFFFTCLTSFETLGKGSGMECPNKMKQKGRSRGKQLPR